MQLIGFTGILAGYGSGIEEGVLLTEHRFGNYPSFAPFFFFSIFLTIIFDYLGKRSILFFSE